MVTGMVTGMGEGGSGGVTVFSHLQTSLGTDNKIYFQQIRKRRARDSDLVQNNTFL